MMRTEERERERSCWCKKTTGVGNGKIGGREAE